MLAINSSPPSHWSIITRLLKKPATVNAGVMGDHSFVECREAMLANRKFGRKLSQERRFSSHSLEAWPPGRLFQQAAYIGEHSLDDRVVSGLAWLADHQLNIDEVGPSSRTQY